MKEVLPGRAEGDPEGDWPKEFADQLNTDAVLAAAMLAATPMMESVHPEPEEFVEEDILE